jgi:hypothetical protein
MANTIKVLAVDRKDPNFFHRFKYPFDKIKGTEFNEYNFEVDYKEYSETILDGIENYDFFAYHLDIISFYQLLIS